MARRGGQDGLGKMNEGFIYDERDGSGSGTLCRSRRRGLVSMGCIAETFEDGALYMRMEETKK